MISTQATLISTIVVVVAVTVAHKAHEAVLSSASGQGVMGGRQQEPVLVNETDLFDDDSGLAESSMELSSPGTSIHRPGADMGLTQAIDEERAPELYQLLDEAHRYMIKVHEDPFYGKVADICTNQHENCAFWALLGECEANPGYMQTHCAPVCQSCDMLHVDMRCPLDLNAKDALPGPGDLNRLFEGILANPEYLKYEPVVLSRPGLPDGVTSEDDVDYFVGGPWVLLFENMLTDDEAERLIELGHVEGYERSSDVGSKNADGTHEKYVNAGRTSTNAWCNHECYEDPVAKDVMNRISNVTGIPEENSEHLQLLRYQYSQFYQSHNDYIPHQIDRQCGVRILTFYLYLNDVEEGGGTNFPRLSLTVEPKRGRAVLWPSVLDSDPNQKDARTNHQALPVRKGVKYGANAWIHQRDFKTANLKACT